MVGGKERHNNEGDSISSCNVICVAEKMKNMVVHQQNKEICLCCPWQLHMIVMCKSRHWSSELFVLMIGCLWITCA